MTVREKVDRRASTRRSGWIGHDACSSCPPIPDEMVERLIYHVSSSRFCPRRRAGSGLASRCCSSCSRGGNYPMRTFGQGTGSLARNARYPWPRLLAVLALGLRIRVQCLGDLITCLVPRNAAHALPTRTSLCVNLRASEDFRSRYDRVLVSRATSARGRRKWITSLSPASSMFLRHTFPSPVAGGVPRRSHRAR